MLISSIKAILVIRECKVKVSNIIFSKFLIDIII